MRGAAARIAEIVGIVLAAALGPAGGHGFAAVVAQDEAAQRKVLVDVLARSSPRSAVQDFLNAVVHFEANERLTVALGNDAPHFRQGAAPPCVKRQEQQHRA